MGAWRHVVALSAGDVPRLGQRGSGVENLLCHRAGVVIYSTHGVGPGAAFSPTRDLPVCQRRVRGRSGGGRAGRPMGHAGALAQCDGGGQFLCLLYANTDFSIGAEIRNGFNFLLV